MPHDVDAEAARLAALQHGVFAREQIRRFIPGRALVARRVDAGVWVPVEPGVFRLRGVRRSWEQRVMARCLSWGRGAVACHRAAGPLWLFPGLRPGPVEVTVPRTRTRGDRPGIAHRRDLDAADVDAIANIPVTSAARTLIDLAGVMPGGIVEVALDDALRRRLTSIPKLRWRLERTPRRAGNPVIRELLEARAGIAIPDSPFETLLFRALREAGLPKPVTQHEIRIDGRLVAVVGFAFPDEEVAVEADGYRFHSSRVHWDRDRARRNTLTIDGWLVLHITWTELSRNPDNVIATIRSALSRR